MSGCGLSCPDIISIQEIKELKLTNAESRIIMELRQKVAYSKSVRKKHDISQWAVVVDTGSW